MDFQKTKLFLDKLNREFARMSKDPDNVTRLDLDIMSDYVRQLYDALLSESAATATPAQPMRKAAAPRPQEPEPAAPPPAAAAPPPVVVPSPPAAEVTQVSAPAAPPPPPAPVEEKPAPAAPPVVEPKPQPVASSSRSTDAAAGGMEVLFEERQAKELSDKLSEMPIADLKKAIALNDRLLLTRELFAGDGQVFESTVAALNSFSNFEEAKQYLIEQCIIRYGWLDKKRLDEAKRFVNLIRRRYK